jgi:hypothetical protein
METSAIAGTAVPATAIAVTAINVVFKLRSMAPSLVITQAPAKKANKGYFLPPYPSIVKYNNF